MGVRAHGGRYAGDQRFPKGRPEPYKSCTRADGTPPGRHLRGWSGLGGDLSFLLRERCSFAPVCRVVNTIGCNIVECVAGAKIRGRVASPCTVPLDDRAPANSCFTSSTRPWPSRRVPAQRRRPVYLLALLATTWPMPAATAVVRIQPIKMRTHISPSYNHPQRRSPAGTQLLSW